ncbi:uncharacterized protein LOC104451119 [Eucalyptus grandis]|uniref:Uncharacterized protein n=2 Tax=Eucalyptus grandis TaxID=71139 RepID=A0ACC3KBB1_EUCGR|nr:uncharacterized protein LOC104451119 [Eucalyptus grandis]KAK3423329.1 hypothetical protein EUGRSUZ_F00130 [Eucalyptus grandis]
MERRAGFFSSLKSEVVRGLSPARSRPRAKSLSPPPPARAGSESPKSRSPSHRSRRSRRARRRPEAWVARHAEALSPLEEGPDPDGAEGLGARMEGRWGQWMKGQRQHSVSSSSSSSSSGGRDKGSHLRLLLGVLGAPLAPVHVNAGEPLPYLSVKDTPIETSSAHYILQQYAAASGAQKLHSAINNAYAMGKLRMIASEFETANKGARSKNSCKAAESGRFVLWQMNPDMWYVELALGGSKVHAGCNGKLVWRHTPWLGPHAAKGPVRPLRRALQGLDPKTTASMFAHARCVGEKKINGEDCFVLKLCADPTTLKARCEGPTEIIRHVLFGYFSQKTGLLVHLEDSHLTRIQNNGGDPVYWETTINSFLDDYRPVEGIMIAHSGRSVATLFRFGETARSQTKTRMEEAWTIEEVAFNVPGLSVDCFIPPAELRFASLDKTCELPRVPWVRNVVPAARARVAAPEKSSEL